MKKLLDSGTGSRVHSGMVSSTCLQSGELARLTGVSPDTLRHYEKLGLLATSPRTKAGYRIFSYSAIERVQLVQRSLDLGFSLKELAMILRSHDNGGTPCKDVLKLAEDKVHSLEKQIEELRRKQIYMRRLVREWRNQIERTPKGSRARLLHSLAKSPINKHQNNLKRRQRP
jgi:DNA-binding transcriptional MerR regulator